MKNDKMWLWGLRLGLTVVAVLLIAIQVFTDVEQLVWMTIVVLSSAATVMLIMLSDIHDDMKRKAYYANPKWSDWECVYCSKNTGNHHD
jgi:hypothetical protein